MIEYELLLRATVKLIVWWSPFWITVLALLIFLDKNEKELEKNRQAIKRTERNEREVA